MLGFALWLDAAMATYAPLAAAVFAALWVVALVSILRRKPQWLLGAAAASFIVLLPIVGAAGLAQQLARNDDLAALAQPISRVEVDGASALHPQALVDGLRRMDRRPAHHTHPTAMIDVDVWAGRRHVALRLGQDSGVPDEFWVYDRRLKIGNEVARATLSPADLARGSGSPS